LQILWYNWRDIKNPESGGAEVFAHEVMSRLVKMGYNMTLFTAEYPGCLKNENFDGINIIRSGSKLQVYRNAKSYFRKNKDQYNLIIDGINARPFLSPNIVKEKPILTIIHQLAGKIWIIETPFPLNYLFYYYLEKKWLLSYRETPTVTVSKSTKDDLVDIGFKKVLIVPEGISITPLSKIPQKESLPTIIFVGRLKKYKLADHALQAFKIIKEHFPMARMWVVGDGPIRQGLEREYKDESITFYGHVNDEVKFSLISKSHLILVPSMREGWGLVVTEANAMGTPAVAYDVHGLRDSVKDRETGYLVKDRSPESMAHYAITLLNDKGLLHKYSLNALAFSRQFDWDVTAGEFYKIIKNII